MSDYKQKLQNALLSSAEGLPKTGFSYGRLGDCEISFILSKDGDPYHQRKAKFTGLIDKHRERFINSLENLTFLDLCLNQQFNKEYIDHVPLSKKNNIVLDDPRYGNLIRSWVFGGNLREICAKKKALFVGAEAFLLKELMSHNEYRRLAKEFFPQEDFPIYYISPPNRGLDVSSSIDDLIHDAVGEIEKHGIDVAFFSLGGYAKIAASEISKATGIACCDFGSNLRSLCYSMTRFDTLKKDYCAYMGFSITLSIYLDAAKIALGDGYTNHLREITKNQILLDLNQKFRGVGGTKYVLSEESIGLAKKSLEYVKNCMDGRLSISNLLNEIHKETGFDLADTMQKTD